MLEVKRMWLLCGLPSILGPILGSWSLEWEAFVYTGIGKWIFWKCFNCEAGAGLRFRGGFEGGTYVNLGWIFY